MPFAKGNTLGKGRPKGSTNNNQVIRESFRLLVEQNLGNMQEWLTAAAHQNPYKALQIISDLAQYSLPKLKQVDNTFDVSEDSVISKITVELKQRNEPDNTGNSDIPEELGE